MSTAGYPFTRLVALLVAPLLFAACDDPVPPPLPPPPVQIAVTQTNVSLTIGQSMAVTATVTNTTNTAVIWRSSAPQIAAVSATGEILGVTPGAATITAIAAQDTTKRANVQVTVSQVLFRGLDLNPSMLQLTIGEQRTIIAIVAGVAPGVTWRSSEPSIASVSANGTVIGLASGEAIITAVATADTTLHANALVRVATAPDTMPILGFGAVTERYTAEVAVRGDWAYTSTWAHRVAPGNVVKVWNVASGSPVLRDSLRIPGATTTGDVQISDDGSLLVVAIEHNGGIMIFDRTTNPARPDSLSLFRSANTQAGVHTVKLSRVNGRHYAFLSINPGQGPARLTIVDITDPRNPLEVFSQTMGRPYIHDVFVRDGLLFTALWDDGLRIFDIGGGGRGGSPSNPVVIGNLPTVSGNIHNIWWFHDPSNSSKRYVFLGEEVPTGVLNSSAGDIHVIDVSDMASPRQVAQYNVPGAGAHNFWMDEASGILYAAYYNGGVRAIDVRGDLGSCSATQRNAHGFCDLRALGRERAVGLTNGGYVWGVVWQNGRVYASDMRQGLYVLDASRLQR